MELLPCPFPHEVKRGPFIERDTEDFWFVRVSCGDCGCAGPYVPLDSNGVTKVDEAKAIAAWNTRSPSHGEEIVERVANPEWEAKAEAWHEAIVAEVGEANPFDTLAMLERWKAEAEPANAEGQVSFSRALLDSATDALRIALKIARNEHLRAEAALAASSGDGGVVEGSKCPVCEARARDPWGPDPGDPFWMIEKRQGFDDCGSWVKNLETGLTTRDPSKALRFPSRFAATVAKRTLYPNDEQFEPTEHSWIEPALASIQGKQV